MGRTTIQWIAAWTVGCLASLGPARAQLSKAAVFHGIPVRVVGEFPHGIQVIVGDRVVIRDASDEFVYLKGVYEGSGRGYVLVAEAPGGNGCPEMYRAIDLSAAVPIVSRVFGTCSDVPSVAVTNGASTTTMPGMNGKANIVYRFANGALRETTRPIPLVPTGPDEAPGGDLAALALTKRVDELFLRRAFAAPLLRIMPASSFAEARDMALGGPRSRLAHSSSRSRARPMTVPPTTPRSRSIGSATFGLNSGGAGEPCSSEIRRPRSAPRSRRGNPRQRIRRRAFRPVLTA